jgi:acyl-CoA synthetase (AMP-forming)/AMP-acid ligase II
MGQIEVVGPGVIGAYLRRHAEEGPERLALAWGSAGVALNWAELGRAVKAAKTEVVSARLAGRRVALHSRNPLGFAVLFLALLDSGSVVVPLEPNPAPTRVETMARAFGLAGVIGDELGDGEAGSDRSTGQPFPVGGLVARRRTSGTEVGLATEPAVLLSTSGTTGAPKGVLLELPILLANARGVVEHHRLTASDRGYSPLPLFHVNGEVVGLLSSLVSGAGLIVDDRFHRDRYWDVVDEFRPTWLNCVPAILAHLASRPPNVETFSIRFARSASAPLPVPVLARFETVTGIGVLETYGMTEAAGQIAANPLNRGLRRPGSVGQPVGIQLGILDPEGRRVPVGEVGEVAIKGPMVVRSYIKPDGRDTRIDARGPGSWLLTKDLGFLDSDGYIYLLGRSDDVINRGGEKLFPREIEQVLSAHAGVAEAALVGVGHPVLGQSPVGAVVVRPGYDASVVIEELKSACAAQLGRFQRPDSIVALDRFPNGPTGKTLRKALAEEVAALMAVGGPAQ